MRARRQRSPITSLTLYVEQIINDFQNFAQPHKVNRLLWFKVCFPRFLMDYQQLNGATDEQLRGYDYYNYLMAARKRDHPRARAACYKTMRDDLDAFFDIAAKGMRNPLTMIVVDGNYILVKGYRRLFMLRELGIEKVACRVHKSREIYHRMEKEETERFGMDLLGQVQFQTWGESATDKYWLHDYLKLYDKYLGQLEVENLLELGVYRRASLAIWQQYWPNALIHGFDKKKYQSFNTEYDHENIKFWPGDQANQEDLAGLVSRGKYEVIIDDASHDPDKTLISFEALWPALTDGGWYVIEDLNTNYRGESARGSAIQRVKELVDDVNISLDVEEVHFHHNIAFIKKR